MIKIQDNSDKRSAVCRIYYIERSKATVYDYPGNVISVTGSWNEIRFSAVTFEEKEEINGDMVTQELHIKISGSQKATGQTIRAVCGREIFVRLQYSNGEDKIIGTDDNPVLFSHSSGDSPVAQSLYFKRNSAEKAKHLQSFD
ncbi:MAG: hypothetical protein LBI65_01610 [Candidatus Symbiothrix sp.]|jgi:hypothetical protein|nr:hypothetical protein [Candidatus Symbiothrix sp.]